jgi:hypothetical protein
MTDNSLAEVKLPPLKIQAGFYSKVVPDPLQAELITIGAADKMLKFRLGDIALEVIEYVHLNKICKPDGDRLLEYEICQAVGAFCGRDARTVREYKDISKRYPHEIRQKYDDLSFSHFRIAVRSSEPIKLLEWCMDQTETFGRPATATYMAKQHNLFGEPTDDFMDDVRMPPPMLEEPDVDPDKINLFRMALALKIQGSKTLLNYEQMAQYNDLIPPLDAFMDSLKKNTAPDKSFMDALVGK